MSSNRSTISERLSNLIETNELSDLTFVLKNHQKIYGHRLIFQIASPVFAAMLNGLWIEKDIIELDDVEYEAFKTMMQFIYTDNAPLESVSHAAAVLKVAHKYDIQYLEKIAEEYILSNLEPSDVCEIFEFSKLFNKTEIEEACTSIIQLETAAILDSHSFLDCNLDTLKTIVDNSYLNVEETELFASVEKWVEYNSIKQGLTSDEFVSILRPIICEIRFLTMAADDFVKGPYRSKLLSEDESQTFWTALNGNDGVNIPQGFCTVKEPRKSKNLQLLSASRNNGKYVQITMRWKKENVSCIKLNTDYCSLPFAFNNFMWKISMKQVTLLGRKYLDLNLICNCDNDDKTNTNWENKVEFKFKIVSHKGREGLYSNSRCDVFNKEINTHGWNPFILWSAFTNPSFTFIEDDTIIIEIQMRIEG